MTKEKNKKPAITFWCLAVGCLISLIFVASVSALTLTSEPPPDGEVGLAYNFDLEISGGTPPYNIDVTKGSLPPDLTLESSSISGIPTLPKTARFTLTVTDNAGAMVTRTFRIKILKALTIKTTTLRAGKVGKRYAGALRVTGGKKPYGWSLVSGMLPAGLSFDGATGKLAGTPTEGGTTDVTFQATDALGASQQVSFTIDGIGAPLPPLPPLTDNLPLRLRGATLENSFCCWSNTNYEGWNHIDEFSRWGGNVFSLLIRPFLDGQPVLPGQPLTNRLMKALERDASVIDWALQHNIHVNLRFHQINPFPPPFRIWPDDGRILWTSASAQDELVQAWADLAKHFKGKKGIIFNLLTEPNPWTDTVTEDFVYRAWNILYPRLIDAIRAEDPERWIIVEPLYGDSRNFAASSLGFGFPDLVVSTDPKVMYEFHSYDPHFFTCQGCGGIYPPAGSVAYPGWTTDAPWEPVMFWDKSVLEQRLLPAINFRNAHNVRVIAGEFGTTYRPPVDSRIRWTTDLIDLLEAYGFDWATFLYDPRRVCCDVWDFEGTPVEPLVTSKYALNLPPQ